MTTNFTYTLDWNGPAYSETDFWSTGLLTSAHQTAQIPIINTNAFIAFKEFLSTLITSTEQTFDELFIQFKQHYNHPTYFRI